MSRDTRAAVVAVIAVVAVVFLGFRFLGSPSSQRLVQADLRTVQVMSQLARQIHQKTNSSNNELPVNLDSFPVGLKQNPLTQQLFIYRIRSKTAYELCATFGAKTADPEPQTNPLQPDQLRWSHPAGDHCFAFDTTEPVPAAPYFY